MSTKPLRPGDEPRCDSCVGTFYDNEADAYPCDAAECAPCAARRRAWGGAPPDSPVARGGDVPAGALTDADRAEFAALKLRHDADQRVDGPSEFDWQQSHADRDWLISLVERLSPPPPPAAPGAMRVHIDREALGKIAYGAGVRAVRMLDELWGKLSEPRREYHRRAAEAVARTARAARESGG